MIRCTLFTSDKREIPVYVKPRQYKKLTTKIEKMGFLQKLRFLFLKR